MKPKIKNTSVYARSNKNLSIDVVYQFEQGMREVHSLEKLDDTFDLLKRRVLSDYSHALSEMEKSNKRKIQEKKEKLLLWRKLIEEISCEDFKNAWSCYYFTPKQALISACSYQELQEQYQKLQKQHHELQPAYQYKRR